jgi:3D (Asp-Asp-Asp) domain-containing protein
MFEQKKVKYVLTIIVAVLVFSNIIAVRAILLYKQFMNSNQHTESDFYKAKYEQVLSENQQLKLQIKELEKPAEKWNLYEKRYGKNSRSGSARNNNSENDVIIKRMKVTAYTEFECDKEPDHPAFRITTSGNEVEEWFTAAAGPELPFGTLIYIPYFRNYENKGIFVVEDRGGAIKENCIDIYIADQKTVDEFGVKFLDIYILNYPLG